VRGELGHDVGPPGAALEEVGEDFLVEKLDVVETSLLERDFVKVMP